MESSASSRFEGASGRGSGKDVVSPARFLRELPSPVPPHPADELLTAERGRVFRQVLARRTRRLAVVLEDSYDPHNATAVMRSCDAFGVMRVHCTTARSRLKINRRVSQGAHRYLDLRIDRDVEEACAQLRADGYRILVSDLRADAAVGTGDLAAHLAETPLALIFGCEGFGVSDAARACADGAFLIPMGGFSQSLNLSVSVAVTLYGLRASALAADQPGDLSVEEQRFWYDRWVRDQRGAAAERVCREDADYVPPPDPRATIGSDRRGEELEEFEG